MIIILHPQTSVFNNMQGSPNLSRDSKMTSFTQNATLLPPQEIKYKPKISIPKQTTTSSSNGIDVKIKISYLKRINELFQHLSRLESRGVLKKDDADEIMLQFKLLQVHRNRLPLHQGEVVVVCNGELFFGKDLMTTVKKVREKYGRKPHYSETIQLIEYTSFYDNHASLPEK